MTSIAIIASIISAASILFGYYQYQTRLAERRELDAAVDLASKLREKIPSWGPGGSIPTVSQLIDLAARVHGEPVSRKALEAFFMGDKKVLAGGVKIGEERFDRIPVCFTFAASASGMPDVETLDKEMKKAFGPEASADLIAHNAIRFTVRHEPFVYVGPVALDLDLQTYEKYKSEINKLRFECLHKIE